MILVETKTNRVIAAGVKINLLADRAVVGSATIFSGMNSSTCTVESVNLPEGKPDWFTYNKGFTYTSKGISEKGKAKASFVKKIAEKERTAGFTSSALGSEHQYGSKLEDVVNMMLASQGGMATTYRAVKNGKMMAIKHTPAQMKKVLADFCLGLEAVSIKEASLLDSVDVAKTMQEVDVIAW